ncbi:maleylpyruvate isomerase family mycothiol-dependent enzyme [Pseudarthrobacter oxydans]|uniref:maleylpyruvate isomerase family mycothiol-dependent enzyme n=1 Tax=Pseudarthrobacter oxydans TaxID=1671 RepID=UPI003ECE8E2D
MAARTDKATDQDLVADLLLARRGQAFYNRALKQAGDKELDDPSLVPGWSRRRLIAQVALNARDIALLADDAENGSSTLVTSEARVNSEAAFASTLPPQSLRNLSEHAAVHLSVAWRDLRDDRWSLAVQRDNDAVTLKAMVWLRAREVWLRALDLNTGLSFSSLPRQFVSRMLSDLSEDSGLTAQVREDPTIMSCLDVQSVSADEWAHQRQRSAYELAKWASGRGVLTGSNGRVLSERRLWV